MEGNYLPNKKDRFKLKFRNLELGLIIAGVFSYQSQNEK